ncbi:MAG: hypothetical protein WBB28_17180 [Crinalium sp.]
MPLIPKATVIPGYKPQSSDTSIDADVLMFQLLQQMTPLQKAERTRTFNFSVRRLAISGIRQQYKNASPIQIKQEFIKRCLGSEWLDILYSYNLLGDLVITDPLTLARKIADILEPLNIPYAVGGSVASSLLGETRATQDLDLVIDISASQAEQLINAMLSEFYISESAVAEALEQKTSFNVIYLPSMEKADIFVLPLDSFSRSKMNRRQIHVCGGDSEDFIYIYSAEDIILQKLRWYKQTRSESQKQWRDVLGVLKVQGERLDFNYLHQWAESLMLVELLAQALKQAGLEH